MLALNGFVQRDRVGPIGGEFAAKHVTLLIGPNGSGKSSLLTGAAGLSRSEGQGEVRLAGQALAEFGLHELARHRAMLAQQAILPHGLRGYELLALGAEPLGGVSDEVCMAIARLAKPLGLEALYHRQLNTLSGGEQQRLLIASTLLQVDPVINPDAKLLLLDEPLAGLDWQHQLATLGLLRQYAEQGLAVVASIHDINMACQYADSVWCLHQGQLAACGPPSVITPELIAEVFAVEVRVLAQNGISVMLPK
ncbi:ATP-binding cassette domain-containing protein [Oceanisphaera pacifica]|uniref:ATP-binding cassette domain-containing protein n=1 Tax=Oceanisphaera pacifica TaxID=2818389 RepID=A0ABS3NE19_9GAMM|nr:ATP-binding cassette domain-containing protein [Oceanisphaera pacifica]MBO1518628.1 ATP-binding cassette domain-containing protein [Oceanisphaera pacifica]